MSAYRAMVARIGEKAARAHMGRIGRKGGQTPKDRIVDQLLADPRRRRVVRRLAREFGTTVEAVQQAGVGNPTERKKSRGANPGSKSPKGQQR